MKLKDIDGIAATAGPGLIGALLVGFTFGKSLSLSLQKPFIPVNHIEGHIFSGFLMESKPKYPFLCSVVSGGHTLLLVVNNEFEIIKLGTTNDDAIGEAFDKVAKMLGLGYPGGPELQKLAENGNESRYEFPIGKGKNEYDFSFSGLKTAVLRVIQQQSKEGNFDQNFAANIAASFQKAAIKAITKRVEMALNNWQVNSISLVGGVAANKLMRKEFNEIGKNHSKDIIIPDQEFCGDNAAMIALRGGHFVKEGIKFPLNSNAFASLPKDAFLATK